MVGMVGKPPKGSFVLDVITCIPVLEGRPNSEILEVPMVPFGAGLTESYTRIIAVSPFPLALFPVYAYQCVRSPLAKLIFNGQVCVWEKDRMQINRNKILNLHFINQGIVTVKYKSVDQGVKNTGESNRLVLRNIR
jgi:hypothetical protein